MSSEYKESEAVSDEVCDDDCYSEHECSDDYSEVRWDRASRFIRLYRWTNGYEVYVFDKYRNLPLPVGTGYGYIVGCDRNHVMVDWIKRGTNLHGRKWFGRGDHRLFPLRKHILNVLENGKESVVKYEYDEEKINSAGEVIEKVYFKVDDLRD